MKPAKAPTFQSYLKPYLRKKGFKAKLKASVERLKVISKIVELREKLGMTQAELAARVGVSQPFIARLENDEAANLSLETLVKLVEALDGAIEIRIRSTKKAA